MIVCFFDIIKYSYRTGDRIMRNSAIIQKFFKAYGARDFNAVKDLFSDDIVWHVPGHHPLSGIKHGKDEVIAFLSSLQKANFTIEVLILEANDKYVVNVYRGFSNCEVASIDTLWVLFWEIEDGKIKHAQNFPQDQHATDDFFWKMYSLKQIPDCLAE